MKLKLWDIIGVREDMPELTDEQQAALRESLGRDHATAERLLEALKDRDS